MVNTRFIHAGLVVLSMALLSTVIFYHLVTTTDDFHATALVVLNASIVGFATYYLIDLFRSPT